MGLRITRAVNTFIYGGYELDEDNPDETSDHRIWIRGVRSLPDRKDCLVNIASDGGIAEHVLVLDEKNLEIAPGIYIELIRIRERGLPVEPVCTACGRGHVFTSKNIPQAELALHAPRSYKMIRDNARRRKR